MQPLDELFKALPPDLQEEVGDFAQFLLERKVARKQKTLRMSWAGGLKEYRNQYTYGS